MNHSNSGLAHGTKGAPQATLENTELERLTQEIEQGSSPKKLKVIVIQLGYMEGPILMSDVTGTPTTSIYCIDSDREVTTLNLQIRSMYNAYYEVDFDGNILRFNQEKEKSDKDILLGSLKRLVNRLNEINDGSYVVEDRESNRIMAL